MPTTAFHHPIDSLHSEATPHSHMPRKTFSHIPGSGSTELQERGKGNLRGRPGRRGRRGRGQLAAAQSALELVNNQSVSLSAQSESDSLSPSSSAFLHSPQSTTQVVTPALRTLSNHSNHSNHSNDSNHSRQSIATTVVASTPPLASPVDPTVGAKTPPPLASPVASAVASTPLASKAAVQSIVASTPSSDSSIRSTHDQVSRRHRKKSNLLNEFNSVAPKSGQRY